MRDYATSVFADDLPGVTESRAMQQSWDWRAILPFFEGTYPLAVVPLDNDTPRSASVRGGGSAYFRFCVAAGATASITWTSPADVKWALVRSR
jgi:hypothetical protein